MAGMEAAGRIELPCDRDSHSAGGFLDFREVFDLLIGVEFVLFRDQVHNVLVFRGLDAHQRFEELHEVADLEEKPNVWVRDSYLSRTSQPRAEKGVFTPEWHRIPLK